MIDKVFHNSKTADELNLIWVSIYEYVDISLQ